MKIMAIDPGGTTGWATFDLLFLDGLPLWIPTFSKHFKHHGQIGPDEHHDSLDRHLDSEMPDLVLLERFEHRNNDFSQLISVEYIGVTKRWCQKNKRNLVLQGASEGIKWSDNKKMKHVDILISPITPNRHANDARRHLLYMLANRAKDPRIRNYVLKQLRDLPV